ncbi:hypothetical protein EXIGLDRAFT_765704 [Exidia glandulosa HHB12029]|uniref:40S ribosomal protein S30 n=1 Tax=Exidia glandulosa HHB12029 TaxID=1314781 RepID=A0A165K9R2_EXIGL|nr:hypothetical protein EXIGLDRAFT_765704 [Exidia glandulosa HHB12029]
MKASVECKNPPASNNAMAAHGSLTKSGRVKAMTPVVEKVARLKKKKSGRAGMRQRYNKRFTNVTMTPGRRRRLNPND